MPEVKKKKKKISFNIKKSKYSPNKKNGKGSGDLGKKTIKHTTKEVVKKQVPIVIGSSKNPISKNIAKTTTRLGNYVKPLGPALIARDAWKLLQRKPDSGTTYLNRDLNYMKKGKYENQGLSETEKNEKLKVDRYNTKQKQFRVRPKKDIHGNIINYTENPRQGDIGYLQQGIMEEGGIARDYKKEYKKFQSSKTMKKYRATLNKYNRKKGTYGNGDGLDASHSGGAIVGFESSSKNKGKKEKSRLKDSKRRKLNIQDLYDKADKGMFVKYKGGGGVYGSLYYQKSDPDKKSVAEEDKYQTPEEIQDEQDDKSTEGKKCPEGQTWNEQTKTCEVPIKDITKDDDKEVKTEEPPAPKVYSQHDKSYDYKVVDGKWQFTKKGGTDWKDINKGGADKLNLKYPDALKKKEEKKKEEKKDNANVPTGKKGMILKIGISLKKKNKKGARLKKKDCGCKH